MAEFVCLLLACLFVASISSAELPERTDEDGIEWVGPIRKCKGNTDADLTKCMNQVVKDLAGKVADGIPELELPPLDPFTLDKFNYDLNAGPLVVNVAARNVIQKGFTKYSKLKFRVETQENQTLLHYEIEVPKISVDTTYKAGGNAVVIPITGAGPAHMDVSNLKATGHFVAKKAVREDGTPIVQVEKMEFKDLTIGGFHLRARGLYPGNPLINSAIHYVANRYSRQVFEIVKPEIIKHNNDVFVNRILNPTLTKLPHIHDYLN